MIEYLEKLRELTQKLLGLIRWVHRRMNKRSLTGLEKTVPREPLVLINWLPETNHQTPNFTSPVPKGFPLCSAQRTSKEMCLFHIRHETRWDTEDFALAFLVQTLAWKMRKGRDISSRKEPGQHGGHAISWIEWGPPCSQFSITGCKGQAIGIGGELKREAEACVEMAFNTQANGLVYYFVRDITHCSDVHDQVMYVGTLITPTLRKSFVYSPWFYSLCGEPREEGSNGNSGIKWHT